MSETLCRVCLDGNVTMYYIADTELEGIYEKLVNTTFNTRDGKPVTVCYICFSQLQRCLSLSKVSKNSEKILISLINSGCEVTNESVEMVGYNNGMQKKFSFNILTTTVLPPPPPHECNITEAIVCNGMQKKFSFNILTTTVLPPPQHEGNITEANVKQEIIETKEDYLEDSIQYTEIEHLEDHEEFSTKEEVKTDKFISYVQIRLDEKKPWLNGDDKVTDNEPILESSDRNIECKYLTQITTKQPSKKMLYICNKCNEVFTKFVVHSQIHEPNKALLYTCELCKKTLPLKQKECVHIKFQSKGRSHGKKMFQEKKKRSLCLVNLCKNEGTHLFPKDENRKAQWVQAIVHFKPGRPIKKHSHICSAHFKPNDFVRTPLYMLQSNVASKLLKKTAIPSIFPWKNASQPPITSEDQDSSSYTAPEPAEQQESLALNFSQIQKTYARTPPISFVEEQIYFNTMPCESTDDPLTCEAESDRQSFSEYVSNTDTDIEMGELNIAENLEIAQSEGIVSQEE